MERQRLDLEERDIDALARILKTDSETLRSELERRPWYANDVLRDPVIADAVLHGSDLAAVVSPLLLFAVMAHQVTAELGDSTWVADWSGPKSRIPVFDVEPLLEFADAPGRLVFVARLLADFAAPEAPPVPADRLDLDDLVDWLEAVDPTDRIVLLRRLGDLALFQAGVFPDTTGARILSASQAEHLGRSVGLTDEEIIDLVDPASATPGFDTLERLGSAWYRASAEQDPAHPAVLCDIATRIRPARRFLNHLADRYLHHLQLTWAPGYGAIG